MLILLSHNMNTFVNVLMIIFVMGRDVGDCSYFFLFREIITVVLIN